MSLYREIAVASWKTVKTIISRRNTRSKVHQQLRTHRRISLQPPNEPSIPVFILQTSETASRVAAHFSNILQPGETVFGDNTSGWSCESRESERLFAPGPGLYLLRQLRRESARSVRDYYDNREQNEPSKATKIPFLATGSPPAQWE